MITWILIIMIFGSGRAVDHIEFKSKAACVEAKTQIEKELNFGFIIKCVGNWNERE